ncbi:DUF2059 domain-containing protein [Roseateles microcysteis]|uniref:DUF2059 domain-containing protein n=1 Tax=Roseateles microcysteis TaxID=3119057 RepID=UPI002FE5E84A
MNVITKNKLAALALASCAVLAQAQTAASAPQISPAKKELITRLLTIQTANAEGMARNLAGAPLGPMAQEVRIAMQQVPAEKREAAAKAIENDVNKFGEEATRMIKERILKLAPEVVSPILDARFSEDELRQILAWLESPVAKKFDSVSPEMGRALQGKVMQDLGPALDARLNTLRGGIVKHLGLTPPSSSGTPAASKPPAKK